VGGIRRGLGGSGEIRCWGDKKAEAVCQKGVVDMQWLLLERAVWIFGWQDQPGPSLQVLPPLYCLFSPKQRSCPVLCLCVRLLPGKGKPNLDVNMWFSLLF